MKFNKIIVLTLATSILVFTLVSCKKEKTTKGPYFGNGFKNGWADQTSITIWTRLTKNPEMNASGLPFNTLSKKRAQALASEKDASILYKSHVPDTLSLSDMEGACPGSIGEVMLKYTAAGSKDAVETKWESVDASINFTKQWKLRDLSPGTTYFGSIVC